MSAPPPPPDLGGWRPPPPERRGPEPPTLALVIGSIVALAAVVLGVVLVTGGDDGGGERTTDDGGREQALDTADDDRRSPTTDDDATDDASGPPDTSDESSDTTDESSDTSDDDTTTGDGGDGDDDDGDGATGDDDDGDDATATTVALPTTTGVPSGPPPAPPSSVAPPAITSIAQGTYPPDAATLRATLDAYGFPAWWPLPDAYPAAGDPPTVQALGVRDTLINFAGDATEGTTDWNTSWLDANPDIDAAEGRWTAPLPADRFDIAAGVADRTSTSQGGQTSHSYVFEGIGAETGYLAVDLSSTSTGAGEAPGTTVDIYYSGPYVTDPAPIPVGAGTGKQFLALAPASSQLRWDSTSFTLDTYAGVSTATYSADFTTTAADVDAVLAALSDPATFPAELRQVAPGTDDDGYWTQDMAYGDLAGRYSLVKPRPGDTGEVYVTLSFALT